MTPSRNQLCPCGTGKEFKHCCGKQATSHVRASSAVAMPDGTLNDVQRDIRQTQTGTAGHIFTPD